MSIESTALDEPSSTIVIADPFGIDPSLEILPSQRAKDIVHVFVPDATDSVLRPRLFRHSIDPDKKKLEFWPLAEPQGLSPARKELFERRCAAISGYMRGESLLHLAATYRISPWQIRRLRNRCLASHPDGRIWGYRGLIPHKRMKAYARLSKPTLADDNRSRYAGMLTRLFSVHPTVREKVYRHYLRKRVGANEAYIPIASSHRVFIEACRSDGIGLSEYPFTTRYLAIRALATHLNLLFTSDLYASVRAAFGTEAAAKLRVGTGRKRRSAATLPLQLVQFDGHRIHGIYVLRIPHPDGGFVEKIVERPWLLLIQDVVSRAILGWYLVPYNRYDARDVLKAFDRAIRPWKRRQLKVAGLKYHKNAGMPSGVFPRLEWAVWDEVAYDNAKAHLSDWVMGQLTKTLGCAVNAGAVKVPERRAIIEALFRVLNQRYLHRMPNTTGSGVGDHRGENAEKAAVRYHISLTHLEELLEVIIANYNSTPNPALRHRSPLEQIDYFLHQENVVVSQLKPEEQARVCLLAMHETRKVVGNIEHGRRPYVNYLDERYTNEVLARSPELIGTELTLVVDTDDLRSVMAFLPDGSELGILSAMGKWGQTPHSLTTRKLHNSRKALKVQYNADPENQDPVLALVEELTEEAPTNKRAAAQTVEIVKEAGLGEDYHPMEQPVLPRQFTVPDPAPQPLKSKRRSIVF